MSACVDRIHPEIVENDGNLHEHVGAPLSPRPTRLRARAAPRALAGALLLAACGSESDSTDATKRPSPAPTLIAATERGVALQAVLSGTLRINEQNCLTLDDAILSAPAGSWISDSGEIHLAGYQPMAVGDDVRLGGGLVDDLTVDDVGEELRPCVPEGESTITMASIAEGPVFD